MKEQRLSLRSYLFALSILLSAQYTTAAEVWSGGLTPNVIDTDLELDASGGPITLQGLSQCNATVIEALTVNVNVTVINGNNVIIQGNASGQTILRLNPAAGLTITFNLTQLVPASLTFWGSTDGARSRLLILHEGEGTVQFLLPGGQALTLTNNQPTNGPVEFYVCLEPSGTPQLRFERADLGNPGLESQTAYITIGADSLLSYASLDGLANVSAGSMLFDPTNSGIGRMVLQVFNTGAFTMAVQQLTENFAGNFCDVNRNIPAGGTATTNIINSDGSGASDAALMITNFNNTYAEYLIDPYGDLGAASDPINFSGSFDGFRYGVSAGANHILSIQNNAYLDYVGLANNSCPTPSSLPLIIDPNAPTDPCSCLGGVDSFLKIRNYSALTIDGWLNPASVPSTILLGDQSGIYFRSGIDADGNIVNDDPTTPHVFTINPGDETAGAGEYVFDVEAQLQVFGSNIEASVVLNSRLEILSLEVVPFGGPLFPVEGSGNGDYLFLARTFATDITGDFYHYNKAAWMINDRAVFTETAIAHTDVNHEVCQNNDVISEPTYVGGEKWYLSLLRADNPLVPRPLIGFQDSIFQIQSSVALTGVDLFVPTYVVGATVIANFSEFRFYSNGYLVDDGTGRSMILGTLAGSQACDCCSIISDDAHLNIFQDADYSFIVIDSVQDLFLDVSDNNAAVNNEITTDITGQTSIHAIYLGHDSNISIGTNAATIFPFINPTTNQLLIAGDFFNFGTRGGSVGIPSSSSVTGQGGIFVDLNGRFAIEPGFIASIDVMITISENGVVDLPVSQVFFSDQIGITSWQQNLAVNPIIVPTGTEYSDYTLNWLAVTKDPNFVPYIIQDVGVCSCPAVTSNNILNIPTIQGQVNQLQIVNSRIGDPAQINIDSGWVRELLWLSDCRAGEAPVAVVVLQGNGRLGLNNAHRNPDSVFTQTTLGVNGINIVANGSGRIDLNDDMIVNNVCAFLQGPNFSSGDVLEIRSEDPYTLYVTKEGVLDFSSFFTVGATIRFGGNIRVVFEPGATIVLGSTPVEFGDQAVFEVDSAYELGLKIQVSDASVGSIDNTVDPLVSVDASAPNNQYSPLLLYGGPSADTSNLHVTDPYRVRIVGVGTLRFTDHAVASIRTNGILGIETIYQIVDDEVTCSVNTTSVTIEILEAAQFNIGKGNNTFGGVLQVGDVQFFEDGHTINFTLTINGAGAVFELGSGGFFGLGAGVARPNQGTTDNQSNVLADTLFGVNTVTFNLFGGELSANRIFNSDNSNSHSIVIGNLNTMTVNYPDDQDLSQLNASDYLTSGGGNLFLMVPGSGANNGVMRLINRTDDIIINAPWPDVANPLRTVPLIRLFAGILGSTELLSDALHPTGSPSLMFLTLKTSSATDFTPSRNLADGAALNSDGFREERSFGMLGYVDRSMIGRQSFQDVIDGEGGTPGERRSRVYDLGAARVEINTTVPAPGPVLKIKQIRT